MAPRLKTHLWGGGLSEVGPWTKAACGRYVSRRRLLVPARLGQGGGRCVPWRGLVSTANVTAWTF